MVDQNRTLVFFDGAVVAAGGNDSPILFFFTHGAIPLVENDRTVVGSDGAGVAAVGVNGSVLVFCTDGAVVGCHFAAIVVSRHHAADLVVHDASTIVNYRTVVIRNRTQIVRDMSGFVISSAVIRDSLVVFTYISFISFDCSRVNSYISIVRIYRSLIIMHNFASWNIDRIRASVIWHCIRHCADGQQAHHQQQGQGAG